MPDLEFPQILVGVDGLRHGEKQRLRPEEVSQIHQFDTQIQLIARRPVELLIVIKCIHQICVKAVFAERFAASEPLLPLRDGGLLRFFLRTLCSLQTRRRSVADRGRVLRGLRRFGGPCRSLGVLSIGSIRSFLLLRALP